jgi:hypothetical protein
MLDCVAHVVEGRRCTDLQSGQDAVELTFREKRLCTEVSGGRNGYREGEGVVEAIWAGEHT